MYRVVVKHPQKRESLTEFVFRSLFELLMCHQFLHLPSGGLNMIDDQLIEISILMLIINEQNCALAGVDFGDIYGEL
jgi:hypothetical protein